MLGPQHHRRAGLARRIIVVSHQSACPPVRVISAVTARHAISLLVPVQRAPSKLNRCAVLEAVVLSLRTPDGVSLISLQDACSPRVEILRMHVQEEGLIAGAPPEAICVIDSKGTMLSVQII